MHDPVGLRSPAVYSCKWRTRTGERPACGKDSSRSRRISSLAGRGRSRAYSRANQPASRSRTPGSFSGRGAKAFRVVGKRIEYYLDEQ